MSISWPAVIEIVKLQIVEKWKIEMDIWKTI